MECPEMPILLFISKANDKNNAPQTAHAPRPELTPELDARFGVAVYSIVGHTAWSAIFRTRTTAT